MGHMLKIWTDKDPITAQIKGSTVWLQHEILIVTSNYQIHEIWGPDAEKGTVLQKEKDDALVKALKTRFMCYYLPERDQPREKSAALLKFVGLDQEQIPSSFSLPNNLLPPPNSASDNVLPLSNPASIFEEFEPKNNKRVKFDEEVDQAIAKLEEDRKEVTPDDFDEMQL